MARLRSTSSTETATKPRPCSVNVSWLRAYEANCPLQYGHQAVIGGGTAGLAAAQTGDAAGRRTLLIEPGRLGGESTWNGCVGRRPPLSPGRRRWGWAPGAAGRRRPAGCPVPAHPPPAAAPPTQATD